VNITRHSGSNVLRNAQLGLHRTTTKLILKRKHTKGLEAKEIRVLRPLAVFH